jgi:4-amino-4-deoxy-L-arabinose transferase-like glycosyltransferase
MTLLSRPYFLLVFYCLLLVFGLGAFPLIDWDENVYAAVAKSMRQSGDPWQLNVNGQLYAEKPPLYFWLIAASYKFLGLTEFASRLPSVLSGAVSFLVLYHLGKKLVSPKMGILWALLYSSSLLPLLLTRTAYIDHILNNFILISISSFFLYDLDIKSRLKKRIGWILLGSIALGLGVLTKGPIALAIVAMSIISIRFVQRRFFFRFWDLLLILFVFSITAGSFYLINYLLYGDRYLRGFLEFQNKILTQSMESHTGPWFYHFIIVIFGFFPWSFYLLFFKKNTIDIFKSEPIRSLSIAFLVWMSFVLILFSFVQTKLPHYSSSVYIPLSFFVAYFLSLWNEEESPSERKPFVFTSIYLLLFGIIFVSLPLILKYLRHVESLQIKYGLRESDSFGNFGWIPGVILIASSGYHYFYSKKKAFSIMPLVLSVWLSMQIFVLSFATLIMPAFIDISQRQVLHLYDLALKYNQNICFYKYLSFYPMFYRDNTICIMGSYKFKDETDRLSSEEELYLITKKKSLVELGLFYPKRKFNLIAEDAGLTLIQVK